ncbi:MAG: hypothetical protein J6N18_01360 [Kiritimatiellae bacterium]|nr:hypothetical protein [Kiritimatiellia bacterium]
MRKQKNKKECTIILTKPETIFNNEVARRIAMTQKTSCKIVRNVLKKLLAARADFIEDRMRLFGLLMDAWRYAAANVGGLADMIMTTPSGIETDEAYVGSVLAPYAAYNNFVTGALIGEMTSAEELEFTITSGILASNWTKLFSIIHSRGFSDAESLIKAETYALGLNNHLTGIYHSCEKPVLNADWIVAYDTLEALLKTILKDLASYDPMKGARAK